MKKAPDFVRRAILSGDVETLRRAGEKGGRAAALARLKRKEEKPGFADRKSAAANDRLDED